MQNKLTSHIKQAITALQNGELIVLPTETVYGLAADATNPAAIQKIFTVKNRPTNQALSVLIAHNSNLHTWAIDIPPAAFILSQKFWPGPLTIILKRAAHVLPIITGGSNTIGLRCPDHPIMQQILTSFPAGLAAPSANLYGKPPPTCIDEISTTIKQQVKFIIDGGPCKIGLASTVLDLTQNKPIILRLGAITNTAIQQALHN